MPAKPASSSRSKTSRGLHGMDGAIYVGEQEIATSTEWALNLRRDYVSAESFGDLNKIYLAGRTEIEGTFSADPDETNSFIQFGDSVVYLYVPKKITSAHRLLLRVLRRDAPLHMYASGPVTYVDASEGRFTSSTMTIYEDPGTLPHVLRVRAEAKLEELRHELWDRFLRPTVVISRDEWQADAYEAYAEEQHWAAVEAAERSDFDLSYLDDTGEPND